MPMSREELRDTIDKALDLPLSILAFITLILIIIDLTAEISPEWRLRLDVIYWLTWSVFVAEYIAKLLLSEKKRKYVREHWVELAIIAVPFLRILRMFRVLRITGSIALLRFFLYSRFGLSEIGRVLSHRISYLLVITVAVTVFGAIGGFILESDKPGTRIRTFGDALWWSAALVTTVASELFPVTTGGRILGFALMVYSMVVFSYAAASVAAFFIGKERERATESGEETEANAGE